jgi:hypothetical protein
MLYRVVYGETMPAWEKIVPTRRAANRFKRPREHVGDVVFSIARVIEGEPPQSILAAIKEASKDRRQA